MINLYFSNHKKLCRAKKMYREIEESPPPRESYSRLIFLPESPSIHELRKRKWFFTSVLVWQWTMLNLSLWEKSIKKKWNQIYRMSKLSAGESIYASTILSIEVREALTENLVFRPILSKNRLQDFGPRRSRKRKFLNWTTSNGFCSEKKSGKFLFWTFLLHPKNVNIFILPRLSRKSKKTREAVEARAEAKAKTIAFFRSNFSLRECLQWVTMANINRSCCI